MGAVPWIADFLRMMKWDELSAQVCPSVESPVILAKLVVLVVGGGVLRCFRLSSVSNYDPRRNKILLHFSLLYFAHCRTQTEFYKSILGMLASLHAQPCMRPEHPAFTECLLAVSCEVGLMLPQLANCMHLLGYYLHVQILTVDVDAAFRFFVSSSQVDQPSGEYRHIPARNTEFTFWASRSE